MKKFVFPKQYLPIIKNKYFLTFFGFLIWLSFFDRNDFITTWSYRHKLKELQKDKAHYEDEIKRYNTNLTELMTNHDNLEKYARENYFMKKENEDVYLIVDENALPKKTEN